MQYEKILRLALLPTILFFILSLASVALTTHYWILGDWIVPRGVRIVTDNYNQRTQTYTVDDTIVFFIDKETDATITSGCLCLVAAIMGLIAWSVLRKPGMDTQLKAGKRRFWMLAVIVMSTAGAASALASLVLHFTARGDDPYGCTSETLQMSGKANTNKMCTREMASCNFLPQYLRGAEKDNNAIACNETLVVKWLQLILTVNALVVLAMFSVQARLRRTTRTVRDLEPVPKEEI